MDDKDESTKVAMIVVAAIVMAVVAFVVIFGAWGYGSKAPSADNPGPSAQDEAPAAVGEALAKIYFDSGKADVSAEAAAAMKRVLDASLADPAKIILISGFHDTSGDPVQNAELAKARALAARDALVAAGAAADHIKLRKPEATAGGGDAQEARRVEFRVQ